MEPQAETTESKSLKVWPRKLIFNRCNKWTFMHPKFENQYATPYFLCVLVYQLDHKLSKVGLYLMCITYLQGLIGI